MINMINIQITVGKLSTELLAHSYELYDDERIIIKMPQSRVHGLVCGLLFNEITARYKSILEDRDPEPNPATKALIQSIRPLFKTEVRLEITQGRKTNLLPDHHWGLDNAEPAGLILEIAYTQSFDKVKQKANNYFIGSKFQIKMVIAVHFKNDFGVGISVWKGVMLGLYWAMQPVMEQKQIETDSGPVEGYLAIPLGSFGPRWKVETLSIEAEVDREVRIPYALIVSIVEDAQRSYNNFRSIEYGPPDD